MPIYDFSSLQLPLFCARINKMCSLSLRFSWPSATISLELINPVRQPDYFAIMSDTNDVDLPPPAAPTCSSAPTVPPVLSTLEDTTFFLQPIRLELDFIPRTDDEIRHYFEIEKTIEEVHRGGWRQIALQFPDELLQMRATRCYELLQEGLNCRGGEDKKLSILADTSYGSCCVDEVAAEHVSAEVVVHYGRACLSPTTRLPVIYIFTNPPLVHQRVIDTFIKLFPNPAEKVILMADVSYTSHLPMLVKALREQYSYINVWETKILHCPGALLPNRTLPDECAPAEGESEESQAEKARTLREEWSLLHIGTPLPALLLVLASRIHRIHIIPTRSSRNGKMETEPIATLPLLRRRYALLTHIRSASIIGILVSTLTVKNYLPLISLLRRLIRSRRKKSYRRDPIVDHARLVDRGQSTYDNNIIFMISCNQAGARQFWLQDLWKTVRSTTW